MFLLRILGLLLLALVVQSLSPRATPLDGEEFNDLLQIGSPTDDFEGVTALAEDDTGAIWIGGWTAGVVDGSSNLGGLDAFLLRLNGSLNGGLLCGAQFGTSDDDILFGVTVDLDANAYIIGKTHGTLPGQSTAGFADIFVQKYDDQCNELWTSQFGAYDFDEGVSLVIDPGVNLVDGTDDSVYVAGLVTGALPGENPNGGRDVILRRFNGTTGGTLCTHQFGTPFQDEGAAIDIDSARRVYLAGFTFGALASPNQGAADAFARRYLADSCSPDPGFYVQFGSSGTEGANVAEEAGSVYVGGITNGNLAGQVGSQDAFLAKFDSDGLPVWLRQFGSPQLEQGGSIITRPSGMIDFGGSTLGDTTCGSSSATNGDVFITRFDASGAEVARAQLRSPGPDNSQLGGRLAIGAGDETIIAGSTVGSVRPGVVTFGQSDVFLARYDQLNDDGFRDCPSPSHTGPLNSNVGIDNCMFDLNPAQQNTDGNYIDLSPNYVPDDKTLANSDAAGDTCDADDDNDDFSDADEASGAACGGTITNLLLRDSDGDRALDKAECMLGFDPTSASSKPTLAQCGATNVDADGDKIHDRLEFCYYNTLVNNTDTDGDKTLDGAKDGCEVASLNADRIVSSGDQGMLAAGISGSAAYHPNIDLDKSGMLNSGDQGLMASFISPAGQCP